MNIVLKKTNLKKALIVFFAPIFAFFSTNLYASIGVDKSVYLEGIESAGFFYDKSKAVVVDNSSFLQAIQLPDNFTFIGDELSSSIGLQAIPLPDDYTFKNDEPSSNLDPDIENIEDPSATDYVVVNSSVPKEVDNGTKVPSNYTRLDPNPNANKNFQEIYEELAKTLSEYVLFVFDKTAEEGKAAYDHLTIEPDDKVSSDNIDMSLLLNPPTYPFKHDKSAVDFPIVYKEANSGTRVPGIYARNNFYPYANKSFQEIYNELVKRAGEDAIFAYNTVEDLISNNGPVINGMTDAGYICGVLCASIGGAGAYLEEELIRNKITKYRWFQRALSVATMGRMIGNSVTSKMIVDKDFVRYKRWASYITSGKAKSVKFKNLAKKMNLVNYINYGATAAGAVIGGLSPTGLHSKCPEGAVAPAISAGAGAIMGGKLGGKVGASIGAVVGGFGGIVDEILVSNNRTSAHYFTDSMAGTVLASPFFSPKFAIPLGAGLGTAFAAKFEKGFLESIELIRKDVDYLYDSLVEFLPKEEVDDYIEKTILSSISMLVMSSTLYRRMIMGYKGMESALHSMSGTSEEKSKAFRSILSIGMGVMLSDLPRSGIDFTRNVVDRGLRGGFINKLSGQIRNETLSGENALFLFSSESNAEQMIRKQNSNSAATVNEANRLIGSFISTLLDGSYSFVQIAAASPVILISSIIRGQGIGYIKSVFASYAKEYNEKQKVLNDEKNLLNGDLSKNAGVITERGGIKQMKARIKEIDKELTEIDDKLFLLDQAKLFSMSKANNAVKIFNYLVIGYEIYHGRIKLEDRHELFMSSYQLESMFSWVGDNAATINEMKSNIDNIYKTGKLFHSDAIDLDQINRAANDSGGLEFRGVEIGYDNDPLVKINWLNLDMGKVYLVSGENGCGKSTLMRKLAGIKKDGAFGKGSISHPKIKDRDAKILLISRDYFKPNATLAELVAYPMSNPDEHDKRRIRSILNQLGLNIGLNTKSKNWYGRLSDGQKKIVTLASVLFTKPDIVILDEPFAKIYSMSKPKIRKLLKESLPNSLIVIVSHDPVDTAADGYYDNEIHYYIDKEVRDNCKSACMYENEGELSECKFKCEGGGKCEFKCEEDSNEKCNQKCQQIAKVLLLPSPPANEKPEKRDARIQAAYLASDYYKKDKQKDESSELVEEDIIEETVLPIVVPVDNNSTNSTFSTFIEDVPHDDGILFVEEN